MEEQNRQNQNRETEETAGGQEKKASRFREFADNIPVRSCSLMCLGGAYVAWMGYNLCRNVLAGVDGGGIGFFIAGVLFLIIGGGMAVVGLRGVIRNQRMKQMPAQEEQEELEERGELPEEAAVPKEKEE